MRERLTSLKPGWRSIVAALVLLVGGAIVLWHSLAIPSAEHDRPEHAQSTASKAGSGRDIARLATLERGLKMLEDAQRAGSRTRWDPGDVVARVGPDPDALLDWVRSRTFWVPYRGVLRGARGVLLDRQGNSLDRALLLSALLARGGHPHRLARATLSGEQARELLPLLLTRRPRWPADTSRPPLDPTGEVRQAVARYQLDSVGLARPIQAGAARTKSTLEAVKVRTAEQSAQLLALLGRRAAESDWPERVDSAVDALRDHWWVQVQRSGEWVDLDPTARPSAGRIATAVETLAPETIDTSFHHRVVVRLVTERWTGAALRETVVLDHHVRASDSIGRSLELRILPEQWPRSEARGKAAFTKAVREALLAQTAWQATLLAGGETVADVRLMATGETREAGAGGPFGGLGEGIAKGLGSKRNAGDLTAAWLEYEILVPGQHPDTVRRVLLDLVGEPGRDSAPGRAPVLDDAARLRRSLSLLRSTEILPLPGAFAPEFVVHLTAEGILRSRELLRASAMDTLRGRDPSGVSAPKPLPSYLHALALARFESKDTADVYIARPNILTRHTFLEGAPDGFRVLDATDIVANEVAVDLRERDGFRARLQQGVRDTNAEALLPKESGSFNAVAQAFAFTMTGGWVVVDSATMTGEPLPVTARHRIAAEARAGFLVIAPTEPVRVGDREFVGWWRIDRRTGHTLGVAQNGWGQSMVERAALTIVATFWFEYLICRGAFLWGQTTEAFSPPFPLNLATPLAAMEQEPCSIDALVTALVAAGIEIVAVTWPLVIRTIAGRGYAGLFSDHPWFATGEADPGDLPPIFGKPPGGGAPDPDCPPAGGASPGKQSPSEAAPPEPAEPSDVNEAPGNPESPPAGAEEGKPAAQADDGLPYYPKDGSGIHPVPPEQVEARVPGAASHANAMERELDDALINYRHAADELANADLALERAKVRDDELQLTNPGSEEANQAYQEWLAASRESRAKKDLYDQAAKLLRRAQYQAELARYRAAWLNRLAAANRAAYEAARARDAAAEAWQRSGMTDYNSPEYARFKDASERYRQAQQELADKFWDKPSPPKGTDKTEPAPPQPSIPPTEPAPAPGGGNAPGGSPPPPACGGPASPVAQSVGGVAAAGAGVGVGGGN